MGHRTDYDGAQKPHFCVLREQAVSTVSVLRLDLGDVNLLSSGQTKVVPFDGKAPYRSIILIKISDSYLAYWNICKHISIPLDGGLGKLPVVKNELICQTHGARYRIKDGLCVKGPCKDQSLDPIAVEIASDRIIALIGELD